MKTLILGTAGHIDHGKTALVQALTGIDTDRLPEEKARGITIDLGFANLKLGELSFGIVDVPGHEGFIHNMLAGATGLDAVLLVVAADEGVMPQTREHLAILDLLSVSSGVVALTKSDLVSDDWLQLVTDDVRETLHGTSLQHIPIVAVSAKTGVGLDALRAAIIEQATRPHARRADDLFRLPIDRVFTVRGAGTVVTGTVWSGTVRVEQHLQVRPGGVRARVRGIQVHGSAVEQASAGERAALALTGIDKHALARGDVVVGSSWPESRMLVVQARVIAGTEWTLEQRQRVRVHIGTSETLARVVLLDAERLEAGQQAWVQLRLESPVVTRVGDRVVLRSYSPVTTIAGGRVAELSARKRNRLDANEIQLLQRILDGPPDLAVAAALAQRPTGATADDLALATPHAPPDVALAITQLHGNVVLIGDRFFTLAQVEATIERLVNSVEKLHAQQPLARAIDRAELRNSLPGVAPELIEHALAAALGNGRLVGEGSRVALPGFTPELTPRQSAVRTALIDVLQQAELAAPFVSELSQTIGPREDVQQILKLLAAEGLVQAVAPDLYVWTHALEAARDRTRSQLAGPVALPASAFRSTLPVSRKHLIPLLEYFDRCGITRREGDLRRVLL